MIGRPAFPPLGTILVLGLAGGAIWWAATDRSGLGSGVVTADREIRAAATEEETGRQGFTERRGAGSDPATLERPIFAETRRPARAIVEQTPPPEPEPEPEPVRDEAPRPPEPPEPPQVAFRGTMQDGESRLALIAEGTKAGRWLSEGARIDGWELSEIGQRHIVFRHGSFTHRIELYR